MLLLSYRSAVHEATGFTPSMLMNGRELTLPVDLMYGRSDEEYTGQSQYVCDRQRRLEAVHSFAHSTASLHHNRSKRRYDLRANTSRFEPGDRVWMANPQRMKGAPTRCAADKTTCSTAYKRARDRNRNWCIAIDFFLTME